MGWFHEKIDSDVSVFHSGKIQFGNKSVLILIYPFKKKIPSVGKDKSVILFLRNLHIPWQIQSEVRGLVIWMHLVISSREATWSFQCLAFLFEFCTDTHVLSLAQSSCSCLLFAVRCVMCWMGSRVRLEPLGTGLEPDFGEQRPLNFRLRGDTRCPSPAFLYGWLKFKPRKVAACLGHISW